MVSSLGVTEISVLNLATDVRLNPSYSCKVQVLERFRLRPSSANASANRVEIGSLPVRCPARNSNWQDTRLVRVEGS